jgi:hypothetical protein
VTLPDDQLPALPAQELALSADQLAAEGRFAEAVRERLRAIVAQLVEQGVIAHVPGWTVTELAAQARRARPQLRSDLDNAVQLFSRIWYGLTPATAGDDEAMRGYARGVHEHLARPVVAGVAA